ncbi:MAG TPA: M36 family metallopeptidase, partial [Flavobacteriales bacterium]|nr:M36 family metallopeptidase [Flavobacteriales bacterium]
MTARTILALVLLSSALLLNAQKLHEKVAAELRAQGFHEADLNDLVLKDNYKSDHNGVTHTYFRQRWQGIEIWNGDIAVHTLPNGEVVKVNNGAYTALEKRVNATVPIITAEAALASVLSKTMPGVRTPQRIATEEGGTLVLFANDDFVGEIVSAQLVYQPKGETLRLAWNIRHYVPGGTHWWNVRMDAITGEELDRNDWAVNCGDVAHAHDASCAEEAAPAPMPAAPNDYNVFPWPVESPIHGSRAIRNAPWTTGGIASPFGWHDTNGAAGAEFTDTRGNNCYAQDDTDANDTGGSRPSSATLDFDLPLDLTQAPATYLSPATINLFYWNNLMHDVWYRYGFNEAAGNFQQNNYGRGGSGNDWVNADAQDGSGTNNANFSSGGADG